MEDIEQYIEALIFVSEQSIRTEEIIYCLQAAFGNDFSEEEVTKHIQHITQKYHDQTFAIEVVKMNNGYQFLKMVLLVFIKPLAGFVKNKQVGVFY